VIEGDNRTILVNNELIDWQDKVWNDNQDKVQTLLTDDQKTYAVAEAQKR
jgi:hypothetical protein